MDGLALVCAGLPVADPDQPTSAVVLPEMAAAHRGLPSSRLALALSGIWSPSSRLGEVLLTFALFGGYWLIGFAYHDKRIQRMSWTPVILVSLILMGAGWPGRCGLATLPRLTLLACQSPTRSGVPVS